MHRARNPNPADAMPAQQVGCGTTALGDRPWQPGAPPGYFHALYPPEQFERLRGEAAAEGGVEIRDVEHLHYYRVFRWAQQAQRRGRHCSGVLPQRKAGCQGTAAAAAAETRGHWFYPL